MWTKWHQPKRWTLNKQIHGDYCGDDVQKYDNISSGEQTGVGWRGVEGRIKEIIISCESESRSLQAREQI